MYGFTHSFIIPRVISERSIQCFHGGRRLEHFYGESVSQLSGSVLMDLLSALRLWALEWCWWYYRRIRYDVIVLYFIRIGIFDIQEHSESADLRGLGSSLHPYGLDSWFVESAWWSRSPPKYNRSFPVSLQSYPENFYQNQLKICWVVAGFPIGLSAWWFRMPWKSNSKKRFWQNSLLSLPWYQTDRQTDGQTERQIST